MLVAGGHAEPARKSRRELALLLGALLLLVRQPPLSQAAVVRLAAIGDHGHAGPVAQAVAEMVRSWEPLDGVISVGDVNYPRGSKHTIDQNVGQYWACFIHPYKGRYGTANCKAGGAGANRTNRFFPCPGNHDWGSPKAPDVSAYLDFMPVDGKLTYDVRLGPVHLFSLDSNKLHHSTKAGGNASSHGQPFHPHQQHHRQQQAVDGGGQWEPATSERTQQPHTEQQPLGRRALTSGLGTGEEAVATSSSALGPRSGRRPAAAGSRKKKTRKRDAAAPSPAAQAVPANSDGGNGGGGGGGTPRRRQGNQQAEGAARGPAKRADDPGDASSPHVQAERLRARMHQSDAPWKLVFMHHPPYSSGSHGSSPHLRWPFHEFGAVAVLSGHDHSYERVVGPDGFPYMVNGMGGARTYGFQVRPIEGSAVRFTSRLGGAQLIVADEHTITFRFFSTKDRRRAVDCYQATRVPVVVPGPAGAGAGGASSSTSPSSSDAGLNAGAHINVAIVYSACPLEDSVDGGGSPHSGDGGGAAHVWDDDDVVMLR